MARSDSGKQALVRRNAAAIALLIFGMSQMVGHVLDLRPLRAIGAVSMLAPFPKVFSDVDGVETFSSRFFLDFRTSDGATRSLEITPEVYSRIRGPYNRRNVYGAALSYGPTPNFPKPLFEAVFNYGLIDPGPLRSEIDLPELTRDLRLRIQTKTHGRNDQWLLPRGQNSEPHAGNAYHEDS
jgi:hypothetical protein